MGKFKVGDKFEVEVIGIDDGKYILKSIDAEYAPVIDEDFLCLIPQINKESSSDDDESVDSASVFKEVVHSLLVETGMIIIEDMSNSDRIKYFSTADFDEISKLDDDVIVEGVRSYIEGKYSTEQEKICVGDMVETVDSDPVRFYVCEIKDNTFCGILEPNKKYAKLVVECDKSSCKKVDGKTYPNVDGLMTAYRAAQIIDTL